MHLLDCTCKRSCFQSGKYRREDECGSSANSDFSMRLGYRGTESERESKEGRRRDNTQRLIKMEEVQNLKQFFPSRGKKPSESQWGVWTPKCFTFLCTVVQWITCAEMDCGQKRNRPKEIAVLTFKWMFIWSLHRLHRHIRCAEFSYAAERRRDTKLNSLHLLRGREGQINNRAEKNCAKWRPLIGLTGARCH